MSQNIFRGRGMALALIAPALAVVGLFFVAPLAMSAVVAFRGAGGGFTLEHFAKAFDFYTNDLLFTLGSWSSRPFSSAWLPSRSRAT